MKTKLIFWLLLVLPAIGQQQFGPIGGAGAGGATNGLTQSQVQTIVNSSSNAQYSVTVSTVNNTLIASNGNWIKTQRGLGFQTELTNPTMSGTFRLTNSTLSGSPSFMELHLDNGFVLHFTDTGGSDWLTYDEDNGIIGIGTAVAFVTNFMTFLASANFKSAVTDGSGSAGTAGQILTSRGTGVGWSNAPAGGSGNLTSNANQFLGVPLSVKAAPQFTNTTTTGAYTNINAGNFFGYAINSSGASDSKTWRHLISGTDLADALLSDDGLTALVYDTVSRTGVAGAYRTYDYTSNIFSGPIYVKSTIIDVNNSVGTVAQVLTSTGSGAAWSNSPVASGAYGTNGLTSYNAGGFAVISGSNVFNGAGLDSVGVTTHVRLKGELPFIKSDTTTNSFEYDANLTYDDNSGRIRTANLNVTGTVNVDTINVTNGINIQGTSGGNVAYGINVISGAGNGNTNYTLQAPMGKMLGGSSNVNIVAVMGGQASYSYFCSATFTNLSAIQWGFGVSSVTNSWHWMGPNGTNPPTFIPAGFELNLALEVRGPTNVVAGWMTNAACYTP